MGEEKICILPPDWWAMVARKCAALLRFAAREEYVWDSAGGETVARADLDVDGEAWLSSS